MLTRQGTVQHCAGFFCLHALHRFTSRGSQLTAACLCRSQASLALLPTEVWASISVRGVLTLDDKRAVRSASASLRRLENAATTKVGPALSLEDFLCLG